MHLESLGRPARPPATAKGDQENQTDSEAAVRPAFQTGLKQEKWVQWADNVQRTQPWTGACHTVLLRKLV